MQKYINQLIIDINIAKDDLQVPWITPNEGYELDDWLSGEEDETQAPVKTIEDWSSIKQIELPPVERLNDEQIEALFNALKQLLEAFNCNFVVHFETPIRIQYKVIRSMWQQEHGWMSWHPNFFDVCDDRQAFGSCAFGEEYCQCKKMATYTKGWDETVWTENEDEAFWYKMQERREQRKLDAERRSRERHIEFLKAEFGDDYKKELEKYDIKLKEMKEKYRREFEETDDDFELDNDDFDF